MQDSHTPGAFDEIAARKAATISPGSVAGLAQIFAIRTTITVGR
jgi:hypothetical protein